MRRTVRESSCMSEERQKVLLANDDKEELEGLAELVREAGHEVVALAITVGGVGDAIVQNEPTLAMVLVDADEEHALELVAEVQSFADIPLVVLARSISDRSLRRAADNSLEVLHMPGEPETVAQVLRVARERFEEQRGMLKRIGELDGILERRSTIEQAKGILMERHGIDATEAFEQLRAHARGNQLRVVDVAASVITARDLLSGTPEAVAE